MIVTRAALAPALAVALLAAPLMATAQPNRVARIGFLSSFSPEGQPGDSAAFQQGLRELGYVPGGNIIIEERYAAGQFDKLPELAAELARLKVDVLVASGAPAAHAARNASRVIPVVIASAADPVGTGLVTSLAHPGGNVTGLSGFSTGVVTKRLELLKEVVPSVSRIGALLNPTNPTNPPQLTLIQAAAPALGVTLLVFEVRHADEFDRAFTAIRTKHPGALIIIGDPLFRSHRKKIVELVVKSRLPAIFSDRAEPEAGGLMSYGSNRAELHRRAASYVDKILKGAKAGDLPVEQPTKFELVINLKTAAALRLTIPQSLLLRADEIIQ